MAFDEGRVVRPRLLRSELTGSVYVVTRHRVLDNGVIEATVKHDVTEEFDALARIHLTEKGWEKK
jgi:hypothetical protein